MSIFKVFRRDEDGATAVEYAMALALMSLAILGIWRTAGSDIETILIKSSTSLDTAETPTVDTTLTVTGGD